MCNQTDKLSERDTELSELKSQLSNLKKLSAQQSFELLEMRQKLRVQELPKREVAVQDSAVQCNT